MPPDRIEPWRLALQTALAHTTTAGLQALLPALKGGDPRLIHGRTVSVSQEADGWPVTGACLLCYPAWQGDGLETAAELDEYLTTLGARVTIDLEDDQPWRSLLYRWDCYLVGEEALLDVERELLARQAAMTKGA